MGLDRLTLGERTISTASGFMAAFPNLPDDARDFLFRVEEWQSDRGVGVLLQSAQEPSSVKVAQVIASKAIAYSLWC
ncbi:hypothetical protein [Xenorhabdus bovienii]|uniref:Uncharacterized protein n=1 Tax=Xenorhabdus bovienii str. kraussei Becker Underwood TaxID=1398204 RepID=A0A077PV81_XENBV|nr:hypothetical protein [Xenorhabdus bovienii]CDH24988.1 hypothetical protein XBKB1_3460001 [Xenorhabdus bovienii str. kraussei Becker Underwood]